MTCEHLIELDRALADAGIKETFRGAGSQLPILWVSLAAVVLSLGIYLGLRWNVSSQADELIEHIQERSRLQRTAPDGQ